ncbi:MAG: DUF2309 domain-containing protein [Planctomycetota bacterium]
MPTLERVDTSPHLLHTLRAVAERVAPVWPLDRFVAVNPYLGLLERPFPEAAALLERVAGARSTLSGRAFRERLASGRLRREDLEQAIAQRGSALDAARVLELLASGALDAAPAELPTVAAVLEERTGRPWRRFAQDQLGGWLAAYFDEGHAAWQPEREGSLFASWRAEARIDRAPEVFGARGFRRAVRAAPPAALDACRVALERLQVPPPALEPYLHRLLSSVGGWAAYAARAGWERRLHTGDAADEAVVELLAVLLTFEAALLAASEGRLHEAWGAALRAAAQPVSPAARERVEARALLQLALERGEQRRFFTRLGGAPAAAPRAPRARPRAQAVFCIDVRSEVYRRHLEAADPELETLGFAGFFGFALEHVPLGHTQGVPQCPVLVTPSHRVSETVTDPAQASEALALRTTRHAAKRAWESFKLGAISCFSFVGPVGLAYLPKLFSDGFGLTRPTARPDRESLGPWADRRQVSLAGVPLAERVELAAGALRGMSLTQGFARLVALVGHGSSSVNNPHAAGLDCGACGGRPGEANARVAAATLNDPEVRRALRAREIEVPADTIFLAAQHDTTSDRVTLFEREAVPTSHREDLARLEAGLARATARAREERARRLGVPAERAAAEWARRARDWAQVRPEWGLAGCAWFVAAPRDRTRDLDLEGRAFLHSYAWEQDPDFGVLELILTAPLVVASWINLQYYASTVDPEVFGAGNKVLHNVVGGAAGVLEGNTGDLRVGLPWQSVHDGERLQHEPLRLSAVIEAPTDAIAAVIARHEVLRQLLDHGWIHLFALGADGSARRYAGDGAWVEVEALRPRPSGRVGRSSRALRGRELSYQA